MTSVSPDILTMMEKAIVREESPAAKGMLETLIKNAPLAKDRKKGGCQSPGIPCIYIRVGREMAGLDVVKIAGKAIVQATQEGNLMGMDSHGGSIFQRIREEGLKKLGARVKG